MQSVYSFFKTIQLHFPEMKLAHLKESCNLSLRPFIWFIFQRYEISGVWKLCWNQIPFNALRLMGPDLKSFKQHKRFTFTKQFLCSCLHLVIFLSIAEIIHQVSREFTPWVLEAHSSCSLYWAWPHNCVIPVMFFFENGLSWNFCIFIHFI